MATEKQSKSKKREKKKGERDGGRGNRAVRAQERKSKRHELWEASFLGGGGEGRKRRKRKKARQRADGGDDTIRCLCVGSGLWWREGRDEPSQETTVPSTRPFMAGWRAKHECLGE